MSIATRVLSRSSLVAALAGVLLVSAVGVPSANASEAAAPASAASSGPADGYYYLGINGTDLVWGKTTSCAEGEGDVKQVRLDPEKFSHKWRVTKLDNGRYLIASVCQPTTLLTDTSQTASNAYTRAEFGTDGPTSTLGSWNPSYDYDVAHTVQQEWYISGPEANGDYSVKSSASFAPVNFGVVLTPAF